MSLSIAASRAAQTIALDVDASSAVPDDGHAGLGVDPTVSAPDSSARAQGSGSDEVRVAFESSEPRLPFVIAPLWDANARPPTSNAGSTTAGTAPSHRHLTEAARHHGT